MTTWDCKYIIPRRSDANPRSTRQDVLPGRWSDNRPPEAAAGPWAQVHRHRYFGSYQRCPSPYDIPVDVPEPQSPQEAVAMLQEARERSRQLDMSSFFADVLWITASEWKTEANEFAVAADVGRLLEGVRS